MEIPTVSPETNTESAVISTKRADSYTPMVDRKADPSPSDRALFEHILELLRIHDIPPFTEFRANQLVQCPIKWHSEPGDGKMSAATYIVIRLERKTPSRIPGKPASHYFQYRELHRRKVGHDEMPRGMGMMPKKMRKASGSRYRMTTEKDAS